MDLNTLLTPNRLSVFSLGAYLGPDFTEDERNVAGKKGEDLLRHFGIIPDEFDVPQCHCGRPLYRIVDTDRKLGFRYKCVGGHRKSPTANTFIEYVHTAGELGANKIIQMVYLWVLKMNATIIQKEVNTFYYIICINYNYSKGTVLRGYPFIN